MDINTLITGLRSVHSSKGILDFCQSNLKYINESQRVVYGTHDDMYVVKLPNTRASRRQNLMEIKLTALHNDGLINPVIAFDPMGRWIVARYAKIISSYDIFDDILGYTSRMLKEYAASYLGEDNSLASWYDRLTDEQKSAYDECKYRMMLEPLLDEGLLYGDSTNPKHYGYVDEQLYLIDYGGDEDWYCDISDIVEFVEDVMECVDRYTL